MAMLNNQRVHELVYCNLEIFDGESHMMLDMCWIFVGCSWVPSGKRLHNYGKSPFLMGKLTINGHFQ